MDTDHDTSGSWIYTYSQALIATDIIHDPFKLIVSENGIQISQTKFNRCPRTPLMANLFQIIIALPSKSEVLVHFLAFRGACSCTSLEAVQRMIMALERLKFIMAAATYWCSANNYFPFPRSSV
jgi:hypothetical protein